MTRTDDEALVFRLSEPQKDFLAKAYGLGHEAKGRERQTAECLRALGLLRKTKRYDSDWRGYVTVYRFKIVHYWRWHPKTMRWHAVSIDREGRCVGMSACSLGSRGKEIAWKGKPREHPPCGLNSVCHRCLDQVHYWVNPGCVADWKWHKERRSKG